MDQNQFPKVLVILAGGTIIMTKTANGYQCIKGGFVKIVQTYPNLYSRSFSQKYNLEENECITPKTLEGHRIFYKIIEMPNITDSSKAVFDRQLRR